ncbi:type II toxin-antitoxin system HicA family toxin [Candidatus Woesearchaeota archaeon]|nr:type II toxin-antitoxin system HicA family toxin [Candidatus Woesearchaeota archaeon]
MKLPRVSGMETVKAISRIGYQVKRQRGSHIYLCKEGSNHRELDKGTLSKILKQAGINTEKFTELLR